MSEPLYPIGTMLRRKDGGSIWISTEARYGIVTLVDHDVRMRGGYVYELQAEDGHTYLYSQGLIASEFTPVQLVTWNFSCELGLTDRADSLQFPDYYTDEQIHAEYVKWVLSIVPGGYERAKAATSAQGRKTMTTQTPDDLIRNNDWKLFWEQKKLLCRMLDRGDNSNDLSEDQVERLEGILSLMDAVQECAVDFYGIPKEQVYWYLQPEHRVAQGFEGEA